LSNRWFSVLSDNNHRSRDHVKTCLFLRCTSISSIWEPLVYLPTERDMYTLATASLPSTAIGSYLLGEYYILLHAWVWYDMIWYYTWHAMPCHDMTRHNDMIWHDMACHYMTWHNDTTWYDMICSILEQIGLIQQFTNCYLFYPIYDFGQFHNR